VHHRTVWELHRRGDRNAREFSPSYRCTVKLLHYLCQNWTRKIYADGEIQHSTFLNVALDGGEGAPSCSGCITPGQETPIFNGHEVE
jgi:hypothetical protein